MEEQVGEILRVWVGFLQNLAFAILILVVGWIVGKWIASLVLKVLRGRNIDEALSRFLSSIVQYIVLIIAVISALGTVGVETASLLTVSASAGLAVGLAMQGSLSNFASGVMILFFRPFTLGDRITAGGHTGNVDDIGIFTTTVVPIGNEKIIIPNSQILSGSITNFTVRGTLRGAVDVGVAYGSDVDKVVEVLKGAANRVERKLEDSEVAVVFTGLGASSLDFVVRVWADNANYWPMLMELRTAIYDDLNAAGIEIPFNQIVVHQAPTE
jgi:small conductance mechanosensitive channel